MTNDTKEAPREIFVSLPEAFELGEILEAPDDVRYVRADTVESGDAVEQLASMMRMFHAACADLGKINEALGLAPDDGGADPILSAIDELQRARDEWLYAVHGVVQPLQAGASTEGMNSEAYAQAINSLYESAHPPRSNEQTAEVTVKLCSICNGYGRYQDGDSGTEADGYAPNIVECECADEERLPEYRLESAEQTAQDNINWTVVVALAEEHGNGWRNKKGWSFRCDDDLFNFAVDLIAKGASK